MKDYRLVGEKGEVRFAELFENASSRTEVICTFLALLELIRLKQLVCAQPEAFEEIEIRKAAPVAAAPLAETPAVAPPAAVENNPSSEITNP